MVMYESPVLREFTAPVIRPGGFALTDRGLAACRLPAGARVLDVGCGTGASVNHLRRRHGLAAVGLDLSDVLLKDGERMHGALPLAKGRAEQLPVLDGAVAAVLCECMLSLCPDPEIVLGEMWRVISPGGHLIITDVYARVPDDFRHRNKAQAAGCLRGTVDQATVQRRLAVAGFDLRVWQDHTALLSQLAAQLVWTYGSLEVFWSTVGIPGAGHELKLDRTGCRRPGYYLMVGRKPQRK